MFYAGMSILCVSARLCTFVFTAQVTVIQPPRTGNISKVPNSRHKLSLGLALLFQRLQMKCRQHSVFGFCFPLCFPIGTEAVEGAKLSFFIEKCYFNLLVIVFQNLGSIDHMRGLLVNFLQGQFTSNLRRNFPFPIRLRISSQPVIAIGKILWNYKCGKCGATRESWKGWKNRYCSRN